MFWGLTLKANRRYSQTLKKAFHLSHAALDVPSCTDNELVQITITHDGHDYVLCNLRKNKVEQVILDLTFKDGEEIAFTSQGNGNVHLTGYLLLDDDFDELEEESDVEELSQNKLKKETNLNKKKAMKSEKNKSAEEKDEDEEGSDSEDDSDINDTFELDEPEDDDDDDEDEDDDDESDEEVQQPKAKQIKLDKVQQNGLENGQVSAKEGVKQEKKKDKKKQQNQQNQQNNKAQKSGEKTLQGGVRVEDIQVGSGPEARPGKKIQVYYEGRLKQNNKVFDSTKEGKGFRFGLGKGEVIKGWDIGVAGMKVGGKRRITCPPHMAYGAKGHPPVIPPNSTLVFDIELKGVN